MKTERDYQKQDDRRKREDDARNKLKQEVLSYRAQQVDKKGRPY